MGLVTRLASTIGVAVKEVGSLRLISSEDAVAFLNVIEISNVTVIGVDGFYLEDGRVIPDMGAIADFSELAHDKNIVVTTVGAAKRFISQVSQPNMYFDFTLSEL